ncbi:MAG: NADH-quinone oxidoreductase subunit C [Deltaproteobacteria bacterium]|nr:NADH-quinone oxidoreductase subunit C [Deltaproteobacteria bacterium]
MTNVRALLCNPAAIAWDAVPCRPVADLVSETAAALQTGARLCAWFGVPDGANTVLVAVLAFDAQHQVGIARSEPHRGPLPSLTAQHPQAQAFEREVFEQYGLEPLGHPWLKPLRRVTGADGGPIAFYSLGGGEVHEVAVGPVHAGIIEPGHFRFQCEGELVRNLEIALGYQHRGAEAAFLAAPPAARWPLIETLAGDTSIGHGLAYAGVQEALGGFQAPPRAQYLRAYALELERLANHTGDLGALANDVAFAPTSAVCGKVRGDFLNLTALLCGNRFGRHWLRAGGVRWDLAGDRLRDSVERLHAALADVESAARWLWASGSVRARFDVTGTLSGEIAAQLGLVGPAARASGRTTDVRADHPWGAYAEMPVAPQVDRHGDVAARAAVRRLEIHETSDFLARLLHNLPDGPLLGEPATLPADHLAVALVEGWRGQICHVGLTGRAGQWRHYKVVDPSFLNWPGLAMALRDQAISDFPLCNKSFNLSYCGHDL